MTVLEALIKGALNTDRETADMVRKRIRERDKEFEEYVRQYHADRRLLEHRLNRIEGRVNAGECYQSWIREVV